MDDNNYQKNHPEFKHKNKLEVHADVYIKAANDPTYKYTSLGFRIQNAGSFANYLLNMDKTQHQILHVM
ncbi:hypothetical protein GCM10011518_38820 [Flavobacterium limi]|uniref:Uncharacterized protein n=1 Tax=Flavobacterium limi TaxID=2045105 RepID=A0ABQ1URT7_9FLAO|nr:hypothetical protein GCM10011518_38820 [Flavobacterium limi]